MEMSLGAMFKPINHQFRPPMHQPRVLSRHQALIGRLVHLLHALMLTHPKPTLGKSRAQSGMCKMHIQQKAVEIGLMLLNKILTSAYRAVHTLELDPLVKEARAASAAAVKAINLGQAH
jgi:hypothetical protein